jgi:outer membrane protein TolC
MRSKKMKILGYTIIISVFAACSLFSDPPASDSLKQGETAEQKATHLTLEQAMVMAEDNSQELRLLHLQMAAEKYAFDLSIREFLPRFSVGYSQNDTVIIHDPDVRSKNVSFTISQLLYNGGRTLINRNLTQMQLALDRFNYNKKREDLINQTWNMYNKILMFRRKKELEQEILEITLNQLKISNTERKVGLITEVDLLDVEIQVKNLEVQIKETTIEEESLYFEFKKLLGLEPYAEIVLDGSLATEYQGLNLEDDPEYWLSLALVSNTEFKALQFEIEKKKQEVKMVEQSYLPRVDADFSVFVSSEYFPLQDLGFSLKLNLSFPFKPIPLQSQINAGFSGTAERSTGLSLSSDILPDLGFLVDYRTALLSYESLKIQEEDVLNNLRFNIEQFLKKYKQGVEKMALQNQTLALHKRKLLIQERQLSIGEIKRVDFLESQTDYLKDEISALENQLSLLEMERSFEQLVGIEPAGLNQYSLPKDKEE